MIVRNASMVHLHELARRAGATAAPVLVLGETGTGKEVIAREIHAASGRRERPMLTMNCAAIPPSLMESTLFGHVRGAFSGALCNATGIFRDAHESTLLLDEVGELAPSTQAALLRVLDTGRLIPVGATREVAIDVRIVAATHRDLDAMVGRGEFRADLLYRLNAVTLHVPPLRDRPDEVRPLAEAFAASCAKVWGVPLVRLSEGALSRLESHSWPGNVRQLRNVVERSLLTCSGGVIEEADLPGEVTGREPESVARPAPGDFRSRVATFEIRLIEDALRATLGNKTRAAALLKIPLRTLSHKIKAYRIGGHATPPDGPYRSRPAAREEGPPPRSTSACA